MRVFSLYSNSDRSSFSAAMKSFSLSGALKVHAVNALNPTTKSLSLPRHAQEHFNSWALFGVSDVIDLKHQRMLYVMPLSLQVVLEKLFTEFENQPLNDDSPAKAALPELVASHRVKILSISTNSGNLVQTGLLDCSCSLCNQTCHQK